MSSPVEGSTSSKKIVILQSNDKNTFKVEEKVIVQSGLIKHSLDADYNDGDVIPLPNVNAEILARIIKYCEAHTEENDETKGLEKFDEDFVKVSFNTLTDMIMAANYMNIPGLLNLLCGTVADMIKDESVERVREIFGIKNDFTAGEEQKVRRQNASGL